MSTATLSPTEKILGEIGDIKTRVAVLDPLIKMLAAPAGGGKGPTPESIVAKLAMPRNIGDAVTVDPFGNVRPWSYNSKSQPLHKRVEAARRLGADLKPLEKPFSDFCMLMNDYANSGYRDRDIAKRLDDMGCFLTKENEHGRIEKAALAESSGITGGYTIPPMFSDTLLKLALEAEIIEPRASKKPLTARSLLLPSLDVTTAYGAGKAPALGGVTVFFEQEAATFGESEPQFRQTELTAWLMGFIAYASNTLLQDNAIGMDSFLTQLFTMAVAFYRDYYLFQGNGVGQPLGILNCPASINVTRNQGGHFNWKDVGQMISKIYWPMTGGNSLIWVIHPSVVPDLLQMNDMSGGQVGVGFGRLLFQPYNQGAQAGFGDGGVQPIGMLFNKEVFVSEKMNALGSTGDVMLVACEQYLVGERLDLQIEVSAIPKFINYQTTWRVVTRYEGQPWLNQAITLTDGVYQVSFAALLK